jgi:hypothetical protein
MTLKPNMPAVLFFGAWYAGFTGTVDGADVAVGVRNVLGPLFIVKC